MKMGIFFTVYILYFLVFYFFDSNISREDLFLVKTIYITSILFHEFFHALAALAFGVPRKQMAIKFALERGTACCVLNWPIKRNSYIAILIAPSLLFSVLTCVMVFFGDKPFGLLLLLLVIFTGVYDFLVAINLSLLPCETLVLEPVSSRIGFVVKLPIDTSTKVKSILFSVESVDDSILLKDTEKSYISIFSFCVFLFAFIEVLSQILK